VTAILPSNFVVAGDRRRRRLNANDRRHKWPATDYNRPVLLGGGLLARSLSARHGAAKECMKSISLAVILVVAVASIEVLARPEVCHPATEQLIASPFDRWSRSLQTGDPKKVVASYAVKSILLPTVSNAASWQDRLQND
jgi:hypothetical protein